MSASKIGTATARVLIVALFAPASSLLAQPRINDTAANYSSWNGSDTRNGGAGWAGAWSFSPSGNTGNAGFFLGNAGSNGGDTSSPAINDGSGNSFGFYANGGNAATATRDFASGIMVGEKFSIRMDNGFIDNGSSVGFRLQNAGTSANIFEFSFVGGQSFYNYRISNGSAVNTTQGFTDTGLKIDFTLVSSTGYEIRIFNPANSGSAAQTISGSFATAPTISRLQLYNNNAGSGGSGDKDAFFNQIEVPEPSSAALLAVGAVALLRRRRIGP